MSMKKAVDFADQPLQYDADAHYDAWFNQGNSIAKGPKAPKDINPKDRVIQMNDHSGEQQPSAPTPAPIPSIRDFASKHGLSLEGPKPAKRPLNQPAGYARQDVGYNPAPEPVMDTPEVLVPAYQEPSLDDQIAKMQVEMARLQQAKKDQEFQQRITHSPGGDMTGALIGLLSAYMPADQFHSNPIIAEFMARMRGCSV